MTESPKDLPAPDAPPPDEPEDGDEEARGEADLDLDLAEAEAESGPLARGAAVIKSFWRHAPNGPGVYRMVATDGEVLYVGKARSIRKRIASYTTPERQPARIARMIAQTASMVFVSTRSEAEALLLEANFIKQMKPRYNVLLRDDKSFPYILITGDHEAPQLLKHRGARSGKGDYFGPFASAGAVHRTLNALQRAFLLRTCSDSYYENRTRPCLLHQIKRCSAPCTGEISIAHYQQLVGETRDFLSGRSRSIRHRLAAEMEAAAESLAFEQAARLRDRIAALSAIQGEQSINPKSIPEADVFAIAEEAGQFCIEVFFFRTYQNWGNRAYFPRADRSLGPAAVLDSFLAQFYLERPAPRLVLLSHDVESHDALCAALERARRPSDRHRRAAARREEGARRARRAQRARGARAQARRRGDPGKAARGARRRPSASTIRSRRVEVFDNSHIMGTNAIGAMIVAGPEGFVKGQYRTFNIKTRRSRPATITR